MIPASDIAPALLVAALYVALFGTFELVARRTSVDPELTRKGVHIGAGLFALGFPALFSSHLTVLVLGVLFGGALFVARRLSLLPSVHGVARTTVGELLYPVAVYGTLLLSELTATPHLYTICVLLLALGDGLAGLVGTRVRSRRFRVPGGRKSVAGSATFLAVALVAITGVLIAHGIDARHAVLVALVASLLLTGIEAVSTHGSDNLTVALGGWCIVALTLERTDGQLARDLVVLVSLASALLLLLGRVRRVGVAGAIVASLVTFGAWMLAVPWGAR